MARVTSAAICRPFPQISATILRGDRPGPVADLTVADHEPGEQHRLGAGLMSPAVPRGGGPGLLRGPAAAGHVGPAAERGPVPGQQRRGDRAHTGSDHPGIQAPLGQVQAVEDHLGARLPDPIQGGHQRVQVVDHLVAVGQDRPGHPQPVIIGLEQPDQELAVIGRVSGELVAVQPAVHVGVPQVRAGGAEPPQVGQADPELVRDPFIGDRGGPVRPGRRGHPIGAELGDGAVDDQVPVVGVDRAGGRDHVQAPGPLTPQDRDHVRQGGVPRTRHRRGSINTHRGFPFAE